MSLLGLRQLQDALHRKADQVQQEFIHLSEQLEEIGRKLLEAEDEESRRMFRSEREKLKSQQQALADEINLWRERARQVTQQSGAGSLRSFLEDLLSLEDKDLEPVVERTIYLLDAPAEELDRLSEGPEERQALTPAGRLLERARTEYDLRSGDSAARQRAALEFANRPGIHQEEGIAGEIEAGFDDPDPIVRDMAMLASIQLHRFLAMHVVDLETAHKSVQRLVTIQHPASIPALIEIVESPRTGFEKGEEGLVESYNDRSRMVALLRLIEWHTQEAQAAVQARQFDRSKDISRTAKRALELFPVPWKGALK